jgi:hypothetical protein
MNEMYFVDLLPIPASWHEDDISFFEEKILVVDFLILQAQRPYGRRCASR